MASQRIINQFVNYCSLGCYDDDDDDMMTTPAMTTPMEAGHSKDGLTLPTRQKIQVRTFLGPRVE